jgi:hypothetical protein
LKELLEGETGVSVAKQRIFGGFPPKELEGDDARSLPLEYTTLVRVRVRARVR